MSNIIFTDCKFYRASIPNAIAKFSQINTTGIINRISKVLTLIV